MSNCRYMQKMDIDVISIDDEEVRLSMAVEGNRNALGTAYGGAMFSLADQAFALAANRMGESEVARPLQQQDGKDGAKGPLPPLIDQPRAMGVRGQKS